MANRSEEETGWKKLKIRLISFILMMGALAAATFGQESHLIRDVEIPLEDFPLLAKGYRIQIGAFSSEITALELKQRLQDEFGQTSLPRGEPIHLRFEPFD